MKFDRSNKFDFCYYGQVNSLRLKSSVASNGQVNTLGVTFILLAMVRVVKWKMPSTYIGLHGKEFLNVLGLYITFSIEKQLLVYGIKDYCITGRANPISCAVGLR